MSIKSISIDEADDIQRRRYATDFLNLELPHNASDDQVRAQIQRARPNTAEIFYQEADAPTDANVQASAVNEPASPDADKVELRPEERGRPQAGSLGRNDPRAIIEIPVTQTEDKSGELPVPVGVNGVVWELKRAVELDVPWRVVEALKSAVGTSIRHEATAGNEADVQDVITQNKRIPYSVLKGPTQAEIAQWLEDTGKHFCA
jgi:hypothetical protein